MVSYYTKIPRINKEPLHVVLPFGTVSCAKADGALRIETNT